MIHLRAVRDLIADLVTAAATAHEPHWDNTDARCPDFIEPPEDECDNFLSPYTCLDAGVTETARCDKCSTRVIPPAKSGGQCE